MGRALLLVLLVAACAEPQAPPSASALDSEITVRRVSRSFPLPHRTQAGRTQDGRAHSEAGLIAALTTFAGGRMDALHVALPPGHAHLREQLVIAGVRPRKLRTGPGPDLVAERYIASVPPCPGLTISADGFGPNTPRPGFGCATLANLAADTSDPADLLGNDSAEPPDSRRAARPVSRWREPPAAPAR